MVLTGSESSAADTSAAPLADEAAELAAEGEFAAAAARFQQALQLDPGSAAVHEMLAQCLMADGKDEAAYEAAVAAVQLQPGWPPALLTLGRAARNAGRLKEAAAALRGYLDAMMTAAASSGPAAARNERTSGSEAAASGQPPPEPESPLEADAEAESPAAAAAATAEAAAVEDEEEVAAAREELGEAQELLQLQLGHQLGLPGLRLLEQPGAEVGPGGCVWEAGALLAWFLVQQQQASAGSGSCSCSSRDATGHSCLPALSASAAPSAPFLSGCHVLELGAGGTGVVGLTAACLGASVVATDLPEVLPQLQASAGLNSSMVSAAGGSLRVAALDWRQPDASLLQPAAQQYDWLLGADLVYSLQPVPALVATIQQAAGHTAAAGRPLKILIAHKHRHDDVDQALLGQLRQVGVSLFAVLRDAGSRCTVFANDAARAALTLSGQFI